MMENFSGIQMHYKLGFTFLFRDRMKSLYKQHRLNMQFTLRLQESLTSVKVFCMYVDAFREKRNTGLYSSGEHFCYLLLLLVEVVSFGVWFCFFFFFPPSASN